MKASTSAIVVALLAGFGLFAQAPPAFEVASIRVHSFASADRAGPPIAGNRGTFGGNLKQLIIYAWDLKVYQFSGGPAWVTNPSTTKSPMSSLVRLLPAAADRPVVDQTGLTGFYDYKIEFARDPAAAAADSSAASLFTAVQEQLGLKLESRKGSIEILLIDHAERPSEN